MLGEGDRVDGRYELVRLLGEGGMGRVYLARRIELGGHVAIKLLREGGEAGKTAIARFRREGQAASRLRSESVVRVLDMGTTDEGTPFIVMERVHGQTLTAILAEKGALPLERAVDIVIDVCAVLAEAHALGIIHRDVKTSNVALTKRPDGTELVKVLDFGIAKETKVEVPSFTETAAILGSPKYMSPEQIRDARNVGPSDDLWSLAVMLQEMTTGALPFEAFTIPGLFAKIVSDPPIRARTVRPDLPEAFEALLVRCLEKEPSARFRDAAELAEALAPFASAEGARRASRVRAILTHVAANAWSERPPASEANRLPTAATKAAKDDDATNAPIAREERRPPESMRPFASPMMRLLTGAALVLAIVAALWRVRLSTAPAAASPLPSLMTTAAPPAALPVSVARVQASAGPSSTVPIPSIPPPPAASSSSPTRPPSAHPVVSKATPRTSAGERAPTPPPNDEEFGPRQ